MFISTFRSITPNYKGLNHVGAMNCNDASNLFICDILGELAKSYNLKIAVALSSLRKEKIRKK